MVIFPTKIIVIKVFIVFVVTMCERVGNRDTGFAVVVYGTLVVAPRIPIRVAFTVILRGVTDSTAMRVPTVHVTAVWRLVCAAGLFWLREVPTEI